MPDIDVWQSADHTIEHWLSCHVTYKKCSSQEIDFVDEFSNERQEGEDCGWVFVLFLPVLLFSIGW